MPRVSDLLDRFRPAGAPGAATATGVPADRRETVSAELEPVFAELAPVMQQCDDLRRDSVASAAHREAGAAEQARAIVARARTEAEAERASAAATVRDQAAAAASRALAQAEAEAAKVRRIGDARRQEMLALVLDRVRAELGALIPGLEGPS